MNAHVDGIFILVSELDHLLHRTVCPWHTNQTGKTSHTMVDVDHIVAWFELHQFLERKGHFGIAGMVAL